MVGHGHDGHDAAAPGDNAGHGGHLGPQGWLAMVDQTQCDRLADELEVARATAGSNARLDRNRGSLNPPHGKSI
jgi:hypothetical protein